ncbi:MAG TPA: hypothetical protein VM307_07650, partial [Egibacteraceae bacterium]|nr:hypothetical protein [Egibacteraceae bacterium]
MTVSLPLSLPAAANATPPAKGLAKAPAHGAGRWSGTSPEEGMADAFAALVAALTSQVAGHLPAPVDGESHPAAPVLSAAQAPVDVPVEVAPVMPDGGHVASPVADDALGGGATAPGDTSAQSADAADVLTAPGDGSRRDEAPGRTDRAVGPDTRAERAVGPPARAQASDQTEPSGSPDDGGRAQRPLDRASQMRAPHAATPAQPAQPAGGVGGTHLRGPI